MLEVGRWGFRKLPPKEMNGGSYELLIVLIITFIESLWGDVGVGFREFDEEW